MSDKKLTDQQLLGDQGISVIGLAVSRMGFVWRPTSQHDTGIDGEIEIRDQTSGVVSGLIIKVQSKAVTAFDNETIDGFDYWPNQRDVSYWLGHNVPVILIVSRPETSLSEILCVRHTIPVKESYAPQQQQVRYQRQNGTAANFSQTA